jgi:hypothetical protein
MASTNKQSVSEKPLSQPDVSTVTALKAVNLTKPKLRLIATNLTKLVHMLVDPTAPLNLS